MAKRGLKKGSKCVRHHKSGAKKGRCAAFSKARKPEGAKKRKGGSSKKGWTGWAAVARAARKQQDERLKQNMAAFQEMHGHRRRR